jgi:hypothetical protein
MTMTNSFRVSVYTAKGNIAVSACHSENQKFSDSAQGEKNLVEHDLG